MVVAVLLFAVAAFADAGSSANAAAAFLTGVTRVAIGDSAPVATIGDSAPDVAITIGDSASMAASAQTPVNASSDVSSLSLAATLIAAGRQAPIYSVSGVKEFLNAIGSNRVIVLEKGDYLLSEGYGITRANVSWLDGGNGKELQLNDLENLTIRGVEGARIVSDAANAYILGFYSGTNIVLEKLTIARRVSESSETDCGSLYAENIEGFLLDQVSIQGPSTTPVELWECSDVALRASTIRDGMGGAILASYVYGFSMDDSSVVECHGYPLVYFEESESVSFSNTAFRDNYGSNFIELWAEAGYVENAGFLDCSFASNEFDYFSGTDILPETLGCYFEGNSFDEEWMLTSVAPSSSDEYGYGYGYGEDGPAYYYHFDSGLGFYYPYDWGLDEGEDGSIPTITSPYSNLALQFQRVYAIPAKVDPLRQSKRVFAEASAALVKNLSGEGLNLTISPRGDPGDNDQGIFGADYRGQAKASGGVFEVRVRFVAYNGSVFAMTALAEEAADLEPGGDADTIIASIEYSGGE